jgi:hypothetical protein
MTIAYTIKAKARLIILRPVISYKPHTNQETMVVWVQITTYKRTLCRHIIYSRTISAADRVLASSLPHVSQWTPQNIEYHPRRLTI